MRLYYIYCSAFAFFTQQYLCTYKYIHIYMYNIHIATCQLKHTDLCEYILSWRIDNGTQMEECSFAVEDQTTQSNSGIGLSLSSQACLHCFLSLDFQLLCKSSDCFHSPMAFGAPAMDSDNSAASVKYWKMSPFSCTCHHSDQPGPFWYHRLF